MYFDYANVLVFLAVGIGFVFVNMALGSLVRPHLPTPEQKAPYECGEEPIGDAWIRFDIRYYTVALVYIVFGVEIAFLFPWAAVLKSAFADERIGGMAFLEGVLFIAILSLGLAYVWAKGDLDWVKGYSAKAYRPVPARLHGFQTIPAPSKGPLVGTGSPAAVESATGPAVSLGAGAAASYEGPRA
ncbi:MAG TPA: NADH-quinone oxidoreductase subunit A [Planctomycetota bacterium]|nr:NADH-quinone oxidoreductase subunit A [Planctomycetota bacterium]